MEIPETGAEIAAAAILKANAVRQASHQLVILITCHSDIIVITSASTHSDPCELLGSTAQHVGSTAHPSASSTRTPERSDRSDADAERSVSEIL